MAALRLDELAHAVGRAFADHAALVIDAAHAGLGSELYELSVAQFMDFPASNPVGFLGKNHDAATLRRLIRERGELRLVGDLGIGDARRGMESSSLAVAEGDRSRLVEQERVDV